MKRILTLCYLFFLAMTGSCPTACFGAERVIYFYNPETGIENFALLKTEFNSYLSKQGDYEFQPFDDKKKLEEVIHQQGNIYLLSSWHLEALKQQKIPLQVALIGTFKGSTMQSKVLCTKKDITDFSMLKNTIIAGAGDEVYIRSVLQQIDSVKYKEIAASIKILSVPKDLDALGAVGGFGSASAAISSESSLKILETSDPNQYKQLHDLGYSEKSYLLVVATLGKPGKAEAKVLEILYNMAAKEEGQKKLNLLGLDGWQKK